MISPHESFSLWERDYNIRRYVLCQWCVQQINKFCVHSGRGEVHSQWSLAGSSVCQSVASQINQSTCWHGAADISRPTWTGRLQQQRHWHLSTYMISPTSGVRFQFSGTDLREARLNSRAQHVPHTELSSLSSATIGLLLGPLFTIVAHNDDTSSAQLLVRVWSAVPLLLMYE